VQLGLARKTLMVATLASATALLAGCSGLQAHVGLPVAMGGPSAVAATPAPAAPKLSVTTPAPFGAPIQVALSSGALTSVVVTDKVSGAALPGTVQPGSATWVSTELPSPGASYKVRAVAYQSGATTDLTAAFNVTTVPSSAKIHFGMLPGDGAVVGVNAPIVIRFDHKVTNKAQVERSLHVATSVPVIGSWHWVNSSEVHFRPQTAWPAHTTVRASAELDGVAASSTRFGTRNDTVNFTVGDAHLTTVNNKTHTLTVSINGKVTYSWPTSLGRPQYVTRTGNYIVLEKEPLREMTSCSAAITCDKTSPQYYDLQVHWDTRLSWSGTFIHAAPWSAAAQGYTDVSHGCIHLSPTRAKTYYDLAQYGDLVTVSGTGRPIDDLVSRGDPGASDWNSSWTSYVAGSAIGAAITTDPLTA
jgi:lipoprotein-anchoring transpeptidase ErfK/SrfK